MDLGIFCFSTTGFSYLHLWIWEYFPFLLQDFLSLRFSHFLIQVLEHISEELASAEKTFVYECHNFEIGLNMLQRGEKKSYLNVNNS